MINKEQIKEKFYKITNIFFENEDLLVEALSHKSYSETVFYERMEFLGDSILSFFTTLYLFTLYSDKNEGELSKLRTQIINKENLALVFDKLELNELLLINRKSFKDEIPISIKEDIIESLLAAVFLDSGIDNARKFFELIVENSEDVSEYFFAKSRLQELTLKIYKNLPEFKVKESGDIFTCSVYVNKNYIASAEGKTKKECEKKVAHKAIQMLEKENK